VLSGGKAAHPHGQVLPLDEARSAKAAAITRTDKVE
jgi:hypothetical protein